MILETSQVKSPVVRFKPTVIQHQAAQYFMSHNGVSEILFGGSAGWGKSYLGCYLILIRSLQVSNNRCFIYRSTLTQLKISTMQTFIKILNESGLIENLHYVQNKSESYFKFWNNSYVYFRQLDYRPYDVEYEYVGSVEYNCVFIDEVSQCTSQSIDVQYSRLRHLVSDSFPAKIIMSCNPSRNFLYSRYYKPFIDGTLKPHVKVILGKTTDNTYLPQQYIDNMSKMSESQRERLLYGNWEYSDDINSLFDNYNILQSFSGRNVVTELLVTGQNISKSINISMDLAGEGKDFTTVVFSVDYVVFYILKTKKPYSELYVEINDILNKYIPLFKMTVPKVHIIYDSIGVGYNLENVLAGRIKGSNYGAEFHSFKSSEAAFIDYDDGFKDKQFKNKRAQAFFILSQAFINEQIVFDLQPDEYKDDIVTELINTKLYNSDSNSLIQITPKEQIKRVIGHSPDLSDALAMLFHFMRFKERYRKSSVNDFTVF